MITRITITILLLCACGGSLAAANLVVYGEITDRNHIPVTECNISVKGNKSLRLYHYYNCGNASNYRLVLNQLAAADDSLLITVSHIGYYDSTFSILIGQNKSLLLNLTIRPKYKELNGVTIKAPPVWRRGDTTFFMADAFKEGTERKLKDIIVNLPGFTLSDDGLLRYKNRLVEKITIDGEEIFADKLSLMLNSFPVHVINTIQAIENQSNNGMLKGLAADSKVFVNIGLNEKGRKVVFGDGEAGVGTAGGYSFAPSLFSITGKLKMGLIADMNSLANGLGQQKENELKKGPEQTTQQLLMNNQPLQTIAGFKTKWYLRNQQWDNRLQLNLPLAKKWKSQTELNLLADRQVQNTYQASTLYNSINYFTRTDTSNIVYKPLQLLGSQKFIYSIDSSRELAANVRYFSDFSEGSTTASYLQDSAAGYLQSRIKNNWAGITGQARYTHRKTASLANEWSAEFSKQTASQQGTGLSPNWYQLLQAGTSQYNTLGQDMDTKIYNVSASWQQYRIVANTKISYGIGLWHSSAQLNNLMLLISAKPGDVPIQPAGFSNNGWYHSTGIIANLNRNILLGRKFVISTSSSIGANRLQASEKIPSKAFWLPSVNVGAQNSHILTNRISGYATAGYTLYPPGINQLQQTIYPSSLSSFRQNANIKNVLSKLDAQYGVSGPYPKSLNSWTLGINYSHSFSGILPQSRYTNFLLVQTDSLINLPGNRITLSTTHKLALLFLNAVLSVNASYNYLTTYLGANTTKPATINFYNVQFQLQKNWAKKYYVKLGSQVEYNHIALPQLQTGKTKSVTANINSYFWQRLRLNSYIDITSNISFFNNNLSSPSYADFLFVDAEMTVKPKKGRLNFSVTANNLTNESRFYTNNISIFSQSYFSVPLVKRNIFLSIRYEL